MVISSIFCHNITGYGGGRAQHDEDGHQLLVAVAQIDSQRQKEGSQQNQFDKGSQYRRLYFFDSSAALKTGTDREQRKRCCRGSDAVNGLLDKRGEADIEKGEGKGNEDTKQDGVFQYVQGRPADPRYICRVVRGSRVRSLQGQDDDSKYIIERDCSDDHQGSHACAMVHVVDKCKTQNGSAATIRGLDKGALLCFVLHEDFCQSPYSQDDKESYKKTE